MLENILRSVTTAVDHRTLLTIGLATAGFGSAADAQSVPTGQGRAIVEVVSGPAGTPASFQFTGVPAGSLSAGGTLEAAGLQAGAYETTEVAVDPPEVLLDITCDDQGSDAPSVGNLLDRTATFNIDPGEVVTCVFTHATPTSDGGSAQTDPDDPAGSETNPFDSPDDDLDQFPVPNDLPPSAGTYSAPKAGPWAVTNFAGQMACTGAFSMTRTLDPSRDSGTLEVLDGGRTVVGRGLSDGTADITVQRVPGMMGRYAGSVGGSEGGIPMTIDFAWQLVTDEWIVGYLTSDVSTQGMTCKMFRTYELKYAGG